MSKNFEQLLESLELPTEVKVSLKEAWEEKTADLRDQFAQRYNHDKESIVESIGQMVEDVLTVETQKVIAEKKALANTNKSLTENIKNFRKFAVATLAEEMKELRADRNAMKNNVKMFEQFFINIAKDEVKELHEDTKKLVETRVKLIKEAKDQLLKTKSQFVKTTAENAAKWINETLNEEINVLKEDIKVAKENEFGRKLFESFAKQFETKFFNENTQFNQYKSQIEDLNKKLNENVNTMKNLERKNRLLEDRIHREKILNESIKHLPNNMQMTMKALVENVQTDKLSTAIKKYLPVVMKDENSSIKRKPLMEQKLTVVTGDKQPVNNYNQSVDNDDEYNRIVELAVNEYK